MESTLEKQTYEKWDATAIFMDKWIAEGKTL
jgi:hypothetical protein